MRNNNVVRRRGLFAVVRDRAGWRRHPEWWTLATSAAAWFFIIDATVFAHATHEPRTAAAPFNVIDPSVRAHDWLLMILAMMLPLCIASIQATADRSLWRRRHRAIAAWLCGYIALWLLLGAVLSLVATLPVVGMLSRWSHAASLAFVVAALWQVSPARARALRQCHRVQPLAPAGWRATYDCVRYGWTTAMHCCATCGALMCACWLLGHGVFGVTAMAIVTAVGLAERYRVRPDQRWLAAPIAAIAAIAAATPW